MPLRRSSLVAIPLALALPAAYVLLGKPYLVSNALALCLATAALALLRLDGFPTAILLLTLLLAYDVFWVSPLCPPSSRCCIVFITSSTLKVGRAKACSPHHLLVANAPQVFYTPVMVTVAKGIDAPIKLLAPKAGGTFAMLGLGDVVIPGLLVALCLRFDLARHALRNPKADVTPRSSFPKPYFTTAVVSYIAGLVATIAAMVHSGKAQPALLYLSPACILGPLLTATALGEVGSMWKWRDEEEEEKDDTIEAASHVAQMARKEAKAKAEAMSAAAGEPVENVEEKEEKPAQDDSWMDGTGVAGAEEGPRTRSKRKNTKRK